ncbi:MAG: MMPL family transporter, partial [Oscillospiraceae bacterium]|nr:MMPL family transporter [Oscillospiraceae bacterium]
MGFSADKRKLIYVIAVLLIVGAILTSVWTPATRALSSYMPNSTNAGRGADVLYSELDDLDRAQVLLENVSLSQCELMRDRLAELNGVYKAEFDENYYDHGRAVLQITFDSPDVKAALENVKNAVAQFDGGVASDIGSGWGFGWGINISMIILYAAFAVILIIALVYASRAYRDVFVAFVITGFAVLLNYGTNFILGDISKITMLSAGVIQAVFTMYYTVMICHAYTKNRKESEPREAVVKAVTGSMKQILAAGLIVLAVFGGMMLAGIHLGLEFGIAMVKGVALSIICVFFFLPC